MSTFCRLSFPNFIYGGILEMKEPNPAWKIPKLWICCKVTGLEGKRGKEVSSASVSWGWGRGVMRKLSWIEVQLLLPATQAGFTLEKALDYYLISLRQTQFLGAVIQYCARNYRPSFRENKPKTLVFYD